jgi:hypothetical protein
MLPGQIPSDDKYPSDRRKVTKLVAKERGFFSSVTGFHVTGFHVTGFH